MARGNCTICFDEDVITRKIVVASKVKEQACVTCANTVIKFIKIMKENNKKVKP